MLIPGASIPYDVNAEIRLTEPYLHCEERARVLRTTLGRVLEYVVEDMDSFAGHYKEDAVKWNAVKATEERFLEVDGEGAGGVELSSYACVRTAERGAPA